jgi:hypothetical protein
MRDRSPGIKNSDTKAYSLQFDYNSVIITTADFTTGGVIGIATAK